MFFSPHPKFFAARSFQQSRMILKKSLFQFKAYLGSLIFCPIVLSALFSCAQKDVYLYDKTGTTPASRYGRAAYYPQNYRPYNSPYSRAYTNPYAQPPRNYQPYYDYDSYYVPPTYYNNIESIPSVNSYGTASDAKN